MTRFLVVIFSTLVTVLCQAKEWHLVVLVDASGLVPEGYRQIYGAITTEWPVQVYPLGDDSIHVSARLFGIETYMLGENQLRDIPLSANNKVVDSLKTEVKDCSKDSLIDSTVENHHRFRDQFRTVLMTDGWLRSYDSVVLLSLSPNLQNFKNALHADLQSKLRIINLVKANQFSLDDKALSDGLKTVHSAFKTVINKEQERIGSINDDKKLREKEVQDITAKTQKIEQELADKEKKLKELIKVGEVSEQDRIDFNKEKENLNRELEKAKALAAEAKVEQDKAEAARNKAEEDLKKQQETDKQAKAEAALKQQQEKKSQNNTSIDPVVAEQPIANLKIEELNTPKDVAGPNEGMTLPEADSSTETGPAQTDKGGSNSGLMFFLGLLFLAGCGGIGYKWITKPKLKMVFEDGGTERKKFQSVVNSDGTSAMNQNEFLKGLRIMYGKDKKWGAGFKLLLPPPGCSVRYSLDGGSSVQEVTISGSQLIPLSHNKSVTLYAGSSTTPVGLLMVKKNV